MCQKIIKAVVVGAVPHIGKIYTTSTDDLICGLKCSLAALVDVLPTLTIEHYCKTALQVSNSVYTDNHNSGNDN